MYLSFLSLSLSCSLSLSMYPYSHVNMIYWCAFWVVSFENFWFRERFAVCGTCGMQHVSETVVQQVSKWYCHKWLLCNTRISSRIDTVGCFLLRYVVGTFSRMHYMVKFSGRSFSAIRGGQTLVKRLYPLVIFKKFIFHFSNVHVLENILRKFHVDPTYSFGDMNVFVRIF